MRFHVLTRNIPLGPNVEYSLCLTKILILKKEGSIKKNSYEHRAYESVDIWSLFWVMPHMSTETITLGLKGL